MDAPSGSESDMDLGSLNLRPTKVGGTGVWALPMVALCVALVLSGCGPGGRAGGGPTSPDILPVDRAATADAATRAGESPEGAPGDPDALTWLGDAALSLGDSGLTAPPLDAVRKVEGVPVALLAPLTGRFEGAGRALLDGAQMALFDVGNTEFRLLPFDTGGTVAGAEAAARDAIRRGARMIVGPLLADNVAAVTPIADSARVRIIAFSNSSRVAGGPVLLAGYTPEAQVAAIVRHAVAEGRRTFAILAPSNDYGNVAVDALRAVVEEEAARLSAELNALPPLPPLNPDPNAPAVEAEAAAPEAVTESDPNAPPAVDKPLLPRFGSVTFYDPANLDFAEPIRALSAYDRRAQALERQRAALRAKGDQAARQALKRLEVLDTWGDPPFDALLLPVLDAQTLRILSAQLAFHDVDQPAVMLLGLRRWDGFQNLAAEPGLIGSRYPAARSVHKPRFTQRFTSYFGYAPSDLSALAYDVTAIAAALAGDGRRPPGYDAATLTDPQGFLGVEGLFRFTEDGTTDRGYAILEIRREGTEVVAPAPTSFPDIAPTS
jgi:ABC-type branched-subunit amino acid transport system substrate-binding protein